MCVQISFCNVRYTTMETLPSVLPYVFLVNVYNNLIFFIFPDSVCNHTTIKFVMYNLIHYINEYFEIELCNWGKFYKYDWLIRSNYSLNIIRRSIAVAMIKYIIKPFQLNWFDQLDMIWSPSNTKKGDSLFLKERYLRNNKVI